MNSSCASCFTADFIERPDNLACLMVDHYGKDAGRIPKKQEQKMLLLYGSCVLAGDCREAYH